MNPAAEGPAGIPALYVHSHVAPRQAGELPGYSLSPSTKQHLSTSSMYLLNSSLGVRLHFNIPEPQNMH